MTMPGAAPAGVAEGLARLFARSHQGLGALFAWIAEGFSNDHRAFVVAAAGNDWDPNEPRLATKNERPEPRFPAHYDQVLGVAALTIDGRPSQYSNRGDEPNGTNGVAIFGGDATRLQPGDLGTIVTGYDVPIVGIFSNPRIPLQTRRSADNRRRWVQWAGTSFATPIVSAIAARLWGQNPNLDYKALMAQIIALATIPAEPQLTVPGIRVTQNR